MNIVEGKLLSDAYPGGYYPGSLKWDNGQLKLGTKQSGQGPYYSTVFMYNLNVIRACSKYAGGGLVLVFNGEDMTDSKITFWAAPGPKNGVPPGLQGHGGNCPAVPTTPAPLAVSACDFTCPRAQATATVTVSRRHVAPDLAAL